MGIHDGHRQRMKNRFLTQGLDSFDDHTALELLLYYALPRGDINPLAHTLCDRFGSIAGVLDAPPEELMEIDGVGENTAILLKLIPEMARRYAITRCSFDNILDSSEKAGLYMLPRYIGEKNEVVYLVCLDAKKKVINCRFMGRGSVNSANISIRKIVETALLYNATSAILSHNHSSGIALPSKEDEETTGKVKAALAAVDIALVDHIVVADDDFVSMAENGVL